MDAADPILRRSSIVQYGESIERPFFRLLHHHRSCDNRTDNVHSQPRQSAPYNLAVVDVFVALVLDSAEDTGLLGSDGGGELRDIRGPGGGDRDSLEGGSGRVVVGDAREAADPHEIADVYPVSWRLQSTVYNYDLPSRPSQSSSSSSSSSRSPQPSVKCSSIQP